MNKLGRLTQERRLPPPHLTDCLDTNIKCVSTQTDSSAVFHSQPQLRFIFYLSIKMSEAVKISVVL